MNYTALELLKGHATAKTRHLLINAQLLKTAQDQKAQETEIIEEMSLPARALDGMPKPQRRGSPTEHVALHHHDQLSQRDAQLIGALRELEYFLSVYDAIVCRANFSDKELLLIRLHHDQHMSLLAISDANALGDYASTSTLKRRHARILAKINRILEPWGWNNGTTRGNGGTLS